MDVVALLARAHQTAEVGAERNAATTLPTPRPEASAYRPALGHDILREDFWSGEVWLAL